MSQNTDPETLAESFSQSKRELRFVLITWIAFFIWVTAICATFGRIPPGEPVPTTLGMPSWVVYGVALPWLGAVAVATFFGMRVMKDTDLGGDQDPSSEN